MEALLIIFGQLVFTLLAPFVMLVVDVFASMLGVALSWRTDSGPEQIITSRRARLFAVVMMVTAVIILLVLWVVNSFYFDSAVRRVFESAQARTGISTVCEEIDGSLFSGRVALGNCRLRRADHPTSEFDLQLNTIDLDLRMTSILSTATIDVARVSGLRGWLRNNRNRDNQDDEVVVKPKRAFEIRDLEVADVDLQLSGTNSDGNPFELPVEIQQIRSVPLRSSYGLFDLMFRSNAAGSIAGAPFKISSRIVNDGRETTWRAERIPIASFGAMTGGFLSWFSSGYLDLRVDDSWQLGESVAIDTDWHMQFTDVEVNPPPGTGVLARTAAAPIARFVNSLDGQFPLEFSLQVDEDQFRFKSSLAAAGLWSAVGESVKNVLIKLGVDASQAAEAGISLKESAKSVLDRLRKPKEE